MLFSLAKCLAFFVILDKLQKRSKVANVSNLSLADEEFIYNVSGDIEHFLSQRHTSRVLLFPPVNNFRRFLIHQTCDQFRQQYDLYTFSVGQGLHRRTVVCFRNQLLDPNKLTDSAAAANFESRKKSPVKSWRSERKIDGTANDITSTIARQQKNSVSKMGVEKNGSEIRIGKTNSIDLYRPPALRNYNLGATVDANTATGEKSGSVNAGTTAEAAAEASCATSIIGKATLISTSISYNNSPTHANENNQSFNNNTVNSRCVNDSDGIVIQTSTTTTTASTTTALMVHSESSSSDMATKATTNSGGVTNNGQQRQQLAVRRERRPDRAVYIPRARRSQTTPPTSAAVTVGEVTGIQQQRHEHANANISTTAVLAPMPSTTVHNNDSSGGSGDGSTQQQPLEITTENRVSVNTTASAKLDDTFGNKNTGIAVINSAGKKSKSSSVNSRVRRERPKKSIAAVEGQEEKISKLSLDKKETKQQQKQQQQNQQQQDQHESSALISDALVQETNLITQQQQQLYQQNFHIESSQQIPSSTFFGQQESIETPAEIIVNNEMNSKSGKRTKVKQQNSSNVRNSNKVQNLRIEDVSTENVTMNTATKCDIEAQEFQRASKEINRSNRRIIKQTFVSDVLEIPEKIENTTENDTVNQQSANNILQLPVAETKHSAVDSTTEEEEEEEDDWETMFDDSGECLDPKIVQELTASVGKVKIELPKMDYSAYHTKQSILNDEEFPHVLEVSNFPVEFKNHDLLMVFSQYKESGFDIKWVDDTHALAVFSSSRIAAEVLTMGHPFVVLKPLAEATVESRLKAKKCAASLQPYRQRPETCAALARRLVTGALGVRLKTAAAERENEKRVLREAKERKLLAAKQRDEIWES